MNKETFELKVTIAGISKSVEFQYFADDDSRAWSVGDVAVCQTTGKLWPCKLRAYKQSNGSYRVSMSDVRLNRQYPVVGWNEGVSKHHSRHNSA
jgi:hypothetical protein